MATGDVHKSQRERFDFFLGLDRALCLCVFAQTKKDDQGMTRDTRRGASLFCGADKVWAYKRFYISKKILAPNNQWATWSFFVVSIFSSWGLQQCARANGRTSRDAMVRAHASVRHAGDQKKQQLHRKNKER
nr:hypothetical protein [Pandoravirus massiliensis]